MIVPDDPEMLEGVKRGDQKAFKKMFDAYNPHFIDYAFSYIKMREVDAEDIVADAWTKAFINRQKFVSIYHMFCFIKTAIKNQHIDIHRLARKKNEKLNDYNENDWVESLIDESEFSPKEKEKEQQQILMFLRELLVALPPQRKKILSMFLYKEKNAIEIGQLLNISRQTVLNTKNNAIAELREKFKLSPIYKYVF